MTKTITDIILSHDNTMLHRQYHFNLMCDYPSWNDIMTKLDNDFDINKKLTIYSIREKIKDSDGTVISTKFKFITKHRYEINKTQINGEDVCEEWGCYTIPENQRKFIILYTGE